MSRASPHRTRTSFSSIHIWISCCFPNNFCCDCYSISLTQLQSTNQLWSIDSMLMGSRTDQAHAYIQHVYVLNKLFRIFVSVFHISEIEKIWNFESYTIRPRKCDILPTSVGSMLVHFVSFAHVKSAGITRGTKNKLVSELILFY